MKNNKTEKGKFYHSKVVHISADVHNRLILHTAIKNNKIPSKTTISKEATEAIEKHILKEGYV